MNQKLYINGIEYTDKTQYSMTEEILRAKNAKLHSRIQQGAKMTSILWKLLIGMMVACVALIITVIIMNNKMDNLATQYSTLHTNYQNVIHEYAEVSVDYAQLKEDLDNLGEIIGFTGNEEGVLTYQSMLVKYSAFPGGYTYREDIPLSDEIQKYAYAKCIENGIDYSVFLGLMRHESTFNPNAISKSEDYGLCQINKVNHDWMRDVFGSDWDPMDPYDSIDASTFMLRNLIDSYSDVNSYNRLLMSYNFGHNGAAKHFAQGTNSSAYSRQIMAYAEDYGYTGDGNI